MFVVFIFIAFALSLPSFYSALVLLVLLVSLSLREAVKKIPSEYIWQFRTTSNVVGGVKVTSFWTGLASPFLAL